MSNINREEGLNLIGDRGYEFKQLLISLLDECDINEKYIKKLTSKKSLSYFSTVFTHKSADLLNNYVFFKSLGHSTIEKCIVWYIFKNEDRMKSKINQKLVTDIKRNIIEKNKLSTVYGDKINTKFITISIKEEEKEDKTKRESILHEIVEAFYGAIELILDNEYEIGTGFEVVNKCIENALNKINFEKEQEEDPKIVLNSIFTKYKNIIGTIQYVSEKKDKVTIAKLYQKIGSKEFIIGIGEGHNNMSAQKLAAQNAINIFKQKGVLTFDNKFVKLL
jgi:dsRNA-specific ribonuclease